ncbi:MAG TPA: alanine racemase, partial [Ottowia sp.]|nr:alanine racemase [Ottowia sp.]
MNASADLIGPRLRALIGQGVDAIDTPALVVDLDAANRNLQRMSAFASRYGLRLRPHAKMHKSAQFAHLQLQAGAVGLCVQTVGEAEALAAGGVNDIFITNELLAVGKLRRV